MASTAVAADTRCTDPAERVQEIDSATSAHRLSNPSRYRYFRNIIRR